MRKLIAALFVGALSVLALADTASVRLTTFPDITVADAKSPVSVTAEVRDRTGRLVPNGTRVSFDATMGTFKEAIVETQNGIARNEFIPGGLPGTAKIKVSVLSLNITSSADLEVVADRNLLSQANSYIEIVAPNYLMFSLEQRIIAAAGPAKAVHIQFRDIKVDCDDVQIDIPNYTLRAKKAHLKVGSVNQDFDELYMRLDSRRGYGLTSFEADTALLYAPTPSGLIPVVEKRPHFGPVEIRGTGLTPYQQAVPTGIFEFEDLADTTTMISSEKAVVFPQKEVQFQRAQIMVNGSKFVKLPLFQVSLQPGAPPTLADQVFTVNDNRVSVNYPHYLTLKPGETSLLRLRTGERYGRALTGSGGTFLDYERSWNHGDNMQGNLVVSGLARSDWSVDMNQSFRFLDGSSVYAQLSSPSHRSLYGSVNYSKPFDGFQVNLTASANKTLKGAPYSSRDLTLAAESNPVAVPGLPVRLYYGLTAASVDRTIGVNRQKQTTYGMRMRGRLLPINIDRDTSFDLTFSLAKLAGVKTRSGLTTLGTASLTHRFSNATLVTRYDYYDDGFNSFLIGKQRIGADLFLSGGRTDLSFSFTKGLDSDRLSVLGDFSYRVSGLWNIWTSYTMDRFDGGQTLTYDLMLSYRLGWRSIGLTWSNETKRFGIQLLGTTFN